MTDWEYLIRICNERDCECKDEPPYTRCRYCQAAHALNEAGEVLRDAVRELKEEVTEC